MFGYDDCWDVGRQKGDPMPTNQPIKIISTLYDNIKNIIDTSKHEVAVSINKYDDTCLLGDRLAFER